MSLKSLLASFGICLAATAAAVLWIELLGRVVQASWYAYKFETIEAITAGTSALAIAGVAVALLAPVAWLCSRAHGLPRVVRALARPAAVALVSGFTLWLALIASPFVDLVDR